MSIRLKSRLPIVAVVSLLVALGGFAYVQQQVIAFRADSGETRRAVESALANWQALQPGSLDEPGFQNALQTLSRSRYVVGSWLVSIDGVTVASTGCFARKGTLIESATPETRRVLAALPDGYLTPQQHTAVLLASAVQSEGEHNDIFRHLVRPVRGKDGGELGFIALSCEANASGGTFPGYLYATMLLLIPIGLGIYWLALPWWVLLDARDRGERSWTWASFVLLGNLPALFAYLLTRHPPHSSAPGFQPPFP